MTTTAVVVTAGLAVSGALFAWTQVEVPQGASVDILERLTGLAAFILLVFLIGRRLYASTDKLTEKVQAMTSTVTGMQSAIETNTTAQNKVATALESFAAQQVAANAATVSSQNHLADRNLEKQMAVWTRVEASLTAILDQVRERRRVPDRRGASGVKRRRR